MDGNGNSSVNMGLSPDNFSEILSSLSTSKHLWVGYSGGLDSRVLLELTIDSFRSHPEYQINAVHVHHGLNPKADEWVEHCEATCAKLEVPLTVLWVDAKVTDGRSPEEVAREARFAAFENFLSSSDCLLLGHHAEDQAETILLRLFRGAGPKGLGGIPEKSKVGQADLIRPLLSFSKEDLKAYAEHKNLQWIEDDSNLNTRFDRNFLRHEIMPKLTARWPRVVRSVSRAGALCLETATAVQVLASKDFQLVVKTNDTNNTSNANNNDTLSVSKLLNLETSRRRGVIRYWLQNQGCLLPSFDHMERIDREILLAQPGSHPQLKIGSYEIRREKDILKVEHLTEITTGHGHRFGLRHCEPSDSEGEAIQE